MDASFDQFGGGGWGDQGESDQFAASQQRKSAYDKIPIPVTIDTLAAMSGDEEKYVIGGYSFNTVRLMGKVASVASDAGNVCITYELCDGLASDVRTARRFTVINYTAADLQPTNNQMFAVGQLVQAVGKLRLFNHRLSVMSFNIRQVTVDEITVYELECKLARFYYEKNMAEHSFAAAENATVFQSKGFVTPTRPASSVGHGPVAGIGVGIGTPRAAANRITGTQMTPVHNRTQQPQQQHINNEQPHIPNNWTVQQQRIMQYIRNNAFGEGGVHVNAIRTALNPNVRFDDELHMLLSDGAIYTTLDEEHFAPS